MQVSQEELEYRIKRLESENAEIARIFARESARVDELEKRLGDVERTDR